MLKQYFSSQTKRTKQITIVLVVLLVAGIGTYLLISSHAATPYASTTANNGTVTGTATKQSCSGASSGNCVVFGASTACSSGCSVIGNTIENASGQPVVVHGVNRPSLEGSCTGDTVTGQATGIPASDFATMHNDWNAAVVRLPLDEEFWLSGAARYCSGYQATVQAAVQEAEANHMVVILDLHWSGQGNLADPAIEQQCMPDQNAITFWQQVAETYKNDPNVWFELYNEPHPPGATTAAQWSIWQNGGSVTCAAAYKGAPEVTFTAAGMQQLADTVRATGAKNIILAGGLLIPGVASTLSGVPLLSGSNIAYTVHPYDNDQSVSSQQTEWDTNFGNISAQVPVVVTEFGDLNCGSPAYESAIFSYFQAHNISYAAWAWTDNSCSFPSLISDAAGDCAVNYGCIVQQNMKSYPAVP